MILFLYAGVIRVPPRVPAFSGPEAGTLRGQPAQFPVNWRDMIEFSRSTNYPGSKVLYVLHYPLPYLKALKRKHISKIFQSNNQCNLPSKHLPAGWFFKMVPPLKLLSARHLNYKYVYISENITKFIQA